MAELANEKKKKIHLLPAYTTNLRVSPPGVFGSLVECQWGPTRPPPLNPRLVTSPEYLITLCVLLKLFGPSDQWLYSVDVPMVQAQPCLLRILEQEQV